MTVFFRRIAQTMSVLGGVVLSLVVAITVLSIIGRTSNSVMHSAFAQTNFAPLAQWLLDIGLGPIKGDFELVEAMMAFAPRCFTLSATLAAPPNRFSRFCTCTMGTGASGEMRSTFPQ